MSNPGCPLSQHSSRKRTIAYYEGWAIGRPCDAVYPEQIPAAAYTHLNFAFAFIRPVTFTVAAMNPGDVDLYQRVTALKALNPGLEVWIAIGGESLLLGSRRVD